MNRKNLALCCCLIALFTGCNRDETALPVATMQISGRPFVVELARSLREQETGLMQRDHLARDHGMIFICNDEKTRRFWNHDVRFDLDLLFIDAGGVIVDIGHLDAYSERSISSGAPAMYVIELPGGVAADLKLKPGDRLALPKEALHHP